MDNFKCDSLSCIDRREGCMRYGEKCCYYGRCANCLAKGDLCRSCSFLGYTDPPIRPAYQSYRGKRRFPRKDTRKDKYKDD